jgi:hypothetical protein
MLQFFKKPYPFNDDLTYNTKIIFAISIGVFAFLWLFQPFNISLLPVKMKYYLIVGLGLVTFLSLSVNLLLLPSLFQKQLTSSNWNIIKEIVWNLWVLSTILVGYFFYTHALGVMKFNFNTVIEIVVLGSVPITILIVFNQDKMLRSHLRLADELNKKLQENKSIHEKIVQFTSDYQKDSLAIKVNSLLFIRSANNYIEVFWQEGYDVKNQMVRCSMSNAEAIVKDEKFIFKCHRSYMININHIKRFEGNSQGYKLFLTNVAVAIPVAKSFVGRLQELI